MSRFVCMVVVVNGCCGFGADLLQRLNGKEFWVGNVSQCFKMLGYMAKSRSPLDLSLVGMSMLFY